DAARVFEQRAEEGVADRAGDRAAAGARRWRVRGGVVRQGREGGGGGRGGCGGRERGRRGGRGGGRGEGGRGGGAGEGGGGCAGGSGRGPAAGSAVALAVEAGVAADARVSVTVVDAGVAAPDAHVVATVATAVITIDSTPQGADIIGPDKRVLGKTPA